MVRASERCTQEGDGVRDAEELLGHRRSLCEERIVTRSHCPSGGPARDEGSEGLPDRASGIVVPPRRAADAAAEKAIEPEQDKNDTMDDAVPGVTEPSDEPERKPGRRVGVNQAENVPIDERLEDPEAARQAQFGGMHGFGFPPLPFPMFPHPMFPMVPQVPNAGGVPFPAGGFQASGVAVGAAAGGMPGGNGFIMQTWVLGPDGKWIQSPAPHGGAEKPPEEPPKKVAGRKANPAPKADVKKPNPKKGRAVSRVKKAAKVGQEETGDE
jgi:hypothetical protein